MSKAKIHNGDCLPFLKGLCDECIDCIMTDPPYAVGYANDIYDDRADTVEKLIPQWYEQWYRVIKPNCYVFAYVGVKNINMWIDEAIKVGFDYRNILATRSFNRGVCAPKGNFVFEFQPVIVLSKGKKKKFNQVDFFKQSNEWFNDKRNKNPKEFTYAYSNWIPSEIAYGTETFGSNAKSKEDVHPNAKSVKLEQFLVEISTRKGELVLDPFLGSGTTGVAALQSERDFIGIEMNEHWFGKAKERLELCNPLFSDIEVV